MAPPLAGLWSRMQAIAEIEPEKTALVSCDEHGQPVETFNYGELLDRVSAAAAWLAELGIKPGERVALDFGSSAEFLMVSWAAWAMGVVTVPLDTTRDTDELRTFKITESAAVRVISRTDAKMALARGGHFKGWLSDASHDALILFTSGTTAQPKGVQLTLANLLINAASIGQWLEVGSKDCFLVELPLHHINSTTFCLSALIAGARIIVPPKYSNSRFWEQVSQTGATYTSIVQSILFDQLHRRSEFEQYRKTIKLSRIQIGSAPVVAASAAEFIQQFGIPLYQGYGQTETALRVTGVPMDVSASLYQQLIAENSIGEAMPWANVRVMNARGAIAGEGEEGELLVAGPAVMRGYLGGEEAFREGYFMTGDIGYFKMIEGRRFFFLKGRKKEIIIKGGVNLSPVAIENSLKKISDDISQAYVIGVPDERYGEEVAAAVVFKDGVDSHAAMRRLKIALLRGSAFSKPYEMPRYVRAMRADEIPTTSTGKVQRMMLKQQHHTGYESVYDLFKTSRYRFRILSPQSPYLAAAHELYNHCWQPLTIEFEAFKRDVSKHFVLLALDEQGVIAGELSFTLSDRLTCTSICSASYNPRPVPEVAATPTPREVAVYLAGGHDGVFNFHSRLGASLVSIIPGGRPADKSSLGYTMLLSYPDIDIAIPNDERVSVQLIAAARVLGHDLGVPVEALSRPGGLAAYLSQRRDAHKA